MKKLNLNLQHIGGAEILSREQLKTIEGGGASNIAPYDCDCNNGHGAGAADCAACDTYCASNGGTKSCEHF